MRLVALGLAVAFGAACSEELDDGEDPGTSTSTVADTTPTSDGELTTLELQRSAQRSIISSFGPADIHCAEPESTDPGTSFACELDTDGRSLQFTALVLDDGSVSISID
jgi:hypothetical protein